MKNFIKSSLILLILFYPRVSFCEEKAIPIVLDSDQIDYLRGDGKVAAKGNVKVKKDDIDLSCDELVYDVNSNIAYLKGNVKVVQGATTMYGRDVVYDFNRQTAHAIDLRMESDPMYGEGREGDKIEKKEEYVIKRGYVTTCCLKEPHYRFNAKKIWIYPKKKIVAKNVIFVVGKIPLFYLPYYYQPLNQKGLPQISVGDSKEWGPYILTGWRYNINESNRGRIHIDRYTKRGWGTGFTHKLENKNIGDALVVLYTISDKMYQLSKRNSLFEKYSERAGIDNKYLEDDRYRLNYSYEHNFGDSISVKSEFGKISDTYFMKDFFYREYEKGYPNNFYTLVNKSFTNSSLSVLYQDRVNRFEGMTTYLPQLAYTLFPQQILGTPFYLESTSQAGNLQKLSARSSDEQDAFRFHSYNTVSMPTRIKWLYLKPSAGYYTTFYSRSVYEEDNMWRFTHGLGSDVSTKIFKYFNANFDFFGRKIRGMRHVLTPTVTYQYIHPPKTHNAKLFQFDGVDSLTRTDQIILRLDNKLQYREESNDKGDLLYFSPSVTYLINQKNKGSYFSVINGDLDLYLSKNITLNADNNYDVPTRRITTANIDLSLSHPTKSNSLSLGQRYTRVSSTQGTMSLNYDLTSKLHFSNYMRYEYNSGDMREQEYALRVDLHCWWLDLKFNERQRDFGEGKNEKKEYGVFIIFTLKAFPDLYGGFDRSYHGTKQVY